MSLTPSSRILYFITFYNFLHSSYQHLKLYVFTCVSFVYDCPFLWFRRVSGTWLVLSCEYLSSVAQSCPTLCTPWTAVHQASMSITNSWSFLKLMSIKLVMPSDHLIFCHPLLPLPSIFPSIRVFSNESVLLIRWAKYWRFSFSFSFSFSISTCC